MTPIHANELADPDVLGGNEEFALLRGAPWRRLAVLGDSAAAGVGDATDGYMRITWAERVARGLRGHHPQLVYRNFGRRGLVTAEVAAEQLQPALAFAPDLAIVVAGGNDVLRQLFSPEQVAAELDAIVAPLRAQGADVALFTLFDITCAVALPEPWGRRLGERLGALSALTAAVARRRGALLIDCAGHPRAADPSLYSGDMIHLNMRGQAVCAGAAMRTLSRALHPPVEAFA
ncbi:SGNH/GDSL hydrolase family protein [Conexibacter sp. JD483]|uniref:SGNH/GDSL hydrolase family protein n=1 Tax=unclassified Conexibacter TaxID=2627773 RepID=UPI0027280977|nr:MULTISPECIES: SGNH/GDSL hydrolase family protein [unclassified Conexibacter]MDO8186290.1 SGNH/GDSL hydrolase family protein [Conexibacter sp. CPCC 205706]MDO8197495.1 SGNH/GDSL hydrolase family protein [Conexibacter sp. CPCC 205762]MDR9370278.1 SGNH/GDSL hydrolase family protein [Conexibacter sp. JD483]